MAEEDQDEMLEDWRWGLGWMRSCGYVVLGMKRGVMVRGPRFEGLGRGKKI